MSSGQGEKVILPVATIKSQYVQLAAMGILMMLAFVVIVAMVGFGVYIVGLNHGDRASIPTEATFTTPERTTLLVLIASTLDHRREQGWHNVKQLTLYDTQLMAMFEKLSGQRWDYRINVLGKPAGSENPFGSPPPEHGGQKPVESATDGKE